MSIDTLPLLQILEIKILGDDDFADEFVQKYFQVMAVMNDLPSRLHTFKFECETPLF